MSVTIKKQFADPGLLVLLAASCASLYRAARSLMTLKAEGGHKNCNAHNNKVLCSLTSRRNPVTYF